MYGWIEPFVLPYPANMSREDRALNSWKNFRDCPACGAQKGDCCRTPSCAQLQYAIPNMRDKFTNTSS
jgi:hypothetical protein